jgi:anti-sigma-K factor RskA
MSDETREEQAALAALELLSGEEAAEFRAALQADPALQQTVDDFTAGAAALVYGLPITKAPPGVLSRVLAEVRGSKPAPVAQLRLSFLPWAVAASFAVAATIFYFKMSELHRTALDLRERHDAVLLEKAKAEEERQQSAERLAAANSERDALQKQISVLQSRDALAQVKIATLKSQLAAYAKVGAVAVWDAEKQTGIVKLDNLPEAGAGKDYQLWIIDPKYPAPVSAGVVAAEAGGVARVSFKPDRPITGADKFAVSLERKGGAPAPQGPIVLISN